MDIVSGVKNTSRGIERRVRWQVDIHPGINEKFSIIFQAYLKSVLRATTIGSGIGCVSVG